MTTNVPPRRSEGRAPGMRSGTIKLSMFKKLVCEVSDLSVGGARLHGLDVTELPESFELTLRGAGKPRKHMCTRRWQQGDTIGVEFLPE